MNKSSVAHFLVPFLIPPPSGIMGCGKSKPTDPVKALKAKKGSGTEDIRDKYDIGDILGSGSFGQVRQARLKENDSDVRAVKMIERDNEQGEWSNQEMFVREVELLQTIDHTNIIRYYDFYEDPHFLYVVMEQCSGGEIFQKILEIKRFQETDAASIGRQILSAIHYIHTKNICHRDIKAENFLFASKDISSPIKMIDFGMATKFQPNEWLTQLCGSPHYLSPELIGQRYNHMADLWACGVLLYLLMYGRYPYDGKNPNEIMTKILQEKIEWKSSKVKPSENCIDFLQKLLERNYEKRCSAEEALKHTWTQTKQPTKESSPDPGQSIPTDVLRSAHKKATASRKEIDKKVEELRNQKLKLLDDDFSKGIRYGQRLGPTPKDSSYMKKPEFVRRENKLTTAPGGDMIARKVSMDKMINKVNGQKIEEGQEHSPNIHRSASFSDAPQRKTSKDKVDGVTEEDEKKLADLYKELKTFSQAEVGSPKTPPGPAKNCSL